MDGHARSHEERMLRVDELLSAILVQIRRSELERFSIVVDFGVARVPRGLSPHRIDALPVVRITREHHWLARNCAICLEDYVLDEEVKELPCKHTYHPNCIRNWLTHHNNCPVCRGPVTDDDVQIQPRNVRFMRNWVHPQTVRLSDDHAAASARDERSLRRMQRHLRNTNRRVRANERQVRANERQLRAIERQERANRRPR